LFSTINAFIAGCPQFYGFQTATPSQFFKAIPLTSTFHNGLLEQWIEYDLAGRVNPYGLDPQINTLNTSLCWKSEYYKTKNYERKKPYNS
jgi:hypothetical protein